MIPVKITEWFVVMSGLWLSVYNFDEVLCGMLILGRFIFEEFFYE